MNELIDIYIEFMRASAELSCNNYSQWWAEWLFIRFISHFCLYYSSNLFALSRFVSGNCHFLRWLNLELSFICYWSMAFWNFLDHSESHELFSNIQVVTCDGVQQGNKSSSWWFEIICSSNHWRPEDIIECNSSFLIGYCHLCSISDF